MSHVIRIRSCRECPMKRALWGQSQSDGISLHEICALLAERVAEEGVIQGCPLPREGDRDAGRSETHPDRHQLVNPTSADWLAGDVSIVVQGRLHPRGIEAIPGYQSLGPVIVSCWDSCDLGLLRGVDLRRVAVVATKTPPDGTGYNYGNVLMQGLTTLHGLEHVSTRYAVKVRCDEMWSDLVPIVEAMRGAGRRLVTTNVFFRKDSQYKFHVSDHVMGAKTSDLRACFRSLVDDCLHSRMSSPGEPGWWPTESLIAMRFLEQVGVHPDPAESRRITRENVRMVPVSKLGKFVCAYNNAGRILSSSDEVLAEGSIPSLDEL